MQDKKGEFDCPGCAAHAALTINPADQGPSISRREMLGGAVLAAGLAAAPAIAVERSQDQNQDEMVHINKTYRALVRRTNEASPAPKIEMVKLLPFGGRQVLVRTTAMFCCYSDVPYVFGKWTRPDRRDWPHIIGHQGVGVIEAVGPQVRGLKPGDRVIMNVTANCGWCYNCLRGRSDTCYASSAYPPPQIGLLMDGTPISQDSSDGMAAEYNVCYEENLTPIFTTLSSEEIAPLVCAGSTGVGMTRALHPIESGSTVVVFGCGPVGLSAVQGARIQGASRIIAVDPVARRRQVALKLGATDVVDPNTYGDNLVAHLREMTKGPADRIFAGGQDWANNLSLEGPDYVIEAVGRQVATPKVEVPLDPTGLQVLQQIFDLVPAAGWAMTTGFGYELDDKVKFKATAFTNGSKTFLSCQNGGQQSRRDFPRLVRMAEEGKFDARSLTSNVYKFDDILKSYQEVADRTVIGNVITFS